MKIIVTAAGRGKRFYDFGINKPKYMIYARHKPLFYWSIMSLKSFFDSEEFIFIFNKDMYDEEFVNTWIKKLGIKKSKVYLLDKVTNGQATTVYSVKHLIKDSDSILIYNIDTRIDPGVINHNILKYDGNVTTAIVEGDRFSFCKVNEKMQVIDAAEKVRISQYGSVGSYYFKKWSDFVEIYIKHKEEIIKKYKEAYIAPMYKYMVDNNKIVDIIVMDNNQYDDLGTPESLFKFDQNFIEENK